MVYDLWSFHDNADLFIKQIYHFIYDHADNMTHY